MANLISSNVQANEIVKAEDFNNAFDSTIDNVAKMAASILETSHDFVIGGKISKVSGSWTVAIAPIFGLCASTAIPFCDTESNNNVSVNPGDTTNGDRYGIIEVRGNYATFNEQQRAFNDMDTDTITYQYVDTQKKLAVEFQSSFSDAGTVIAPDKTNGWVKLAEIFVPQGANSIDDCTIFNISSDVSGSDNTGWTNDKAATYDVGHISDLNARFRVQHNEDGSHKTAVIGKSNIKIGIDTDNVNGSNLPVGTTVSVDGTAKSATDSISALIALCASKITAIFDDYVNKGGVYNFNGEVALSSVFDDESNALTNALKIGAAGDGTAYLKIGNATVLKITVDGKLQTSGYTATANTDIVTKAVTDAINTTIANFRHDFDDFVASLGSNLEYTNNLLSRYKIDDTSIQAISTENVALNGLQTIDGIALSAGYTVFLKDQDNKAENGFWEVQTGSWNRITTLDSADTYRYKYFTTSSGTVNKGKLFYCPSELTTYTSGTTELTFNESDVSVAKIADKIPLRNSSGELNADLTGNSATATKLKNSRTLNIQDSDGTNTGTGASFDGSGNATIKLPATIKASITGNCSGSSGSCTGNSATATKVGKELSIQLNGGTATKFDGSAAKSINITASEIGAAASSHTHNYAGSSSAGGAATAANKLATANAIDGVSFNGENAITHYGTCSTAAATAAKTVDCTLFTLVTGSVINVKFSLANTAASPTLNVNSTGAKAIYIDGMAAQPGSIVANRMYRFVYDGTYWQMENPQNLKNTYTGRPLTTLMGTTTVATAMTMLQAIAKYADTPYMALGLGDYIDLPAMSVASASYTSPSAASTPTGRTDTFSAITIAASNNATRVRIADFNPFLNQLSANTSQHILMEFAAIPFSCKFNPSGYNYYGFASSATNQSYLCKVLNGTFLNALKTATGITPLSMTRQYEYSASTSYATSSANVALSVFLPTEDEVFGKRYYAYGAVGGSGSTTRYAASSSGGSPTTSFVPDSKNNFGSYHPQWAIYRVRPDLRVKKLSGSNSWWWLANPYSGVSGNFCYVNGLGNANNNNASGSGGVVPAFCI